MRGSRTASYKDSEDASPVPDTPGRAQADDPKGDSARCATSRREDPTPGGAACRQAPGFCARFARGTTHANHARQGPQAARGRCRREGLVEVRDVRDRDAGRDAETPRSPSASTTGPSSRDIRSSRTARIRSTSRSTYRTKRRSSRNWKSDGGWRVGVSIVGGRFRITEPSMRPPGFHCHLFTEGFHVPPPLDPRPGRTLRAD